MLNIVLYEPEIPPNTGNIIRLAANMGARLHIIEPMAFDWDDKKLRRAGLDYQEFADIQFYPNFKCLKTATKTNQVAFAAQRVFACSTKGQCFYDAPTFKKEDFFVFGPETRGLPIEILSQFSNDHILRIPMLPESRSLNLSNAVAVIVYEAWRQLGFV